MPLMRFAVIPTHNKPRDLQACYRSLDGQVDHVIVIDNASDPRVEIINFADQTGHAGPTVTLIRDPEQPPNLSKLWNTGIKIAGMLQGWDGEEKDDSFFVAILNDDCVVPEGWMNFVVQEMLDHGATAGCTTQWVTRPTLKDQPPVSAFDRLTGWAFVLRADEGLLANEDLRWWYGDNDLDNRARALGGTLLLPASQDMLVINKHANASTTGILAEQAGKDRATFESIYGPVPW